MRKLLLGLTAMGLVGAADAQSGPNWALYYTPSPAEWQQWWTSKADYQNLVAEAATARAAETANAAAAAAALAAARASLQVTAGDGNAQSKLPQIASASTAGNVTYSASAGSVTLVAPAGSYVLIPSSGGLPPCTSAQTEYLCINGSGSGSAVIVK